MWAVVDTRTGRVWESGPKRAALESWRACRESEARWNGRPESVVIVEFKRAEG